VDVLEYLSPSIDWRRFAQGAVSDPMWRNFKDLVLLCHCVEHWRETLRFLSFTRPPQPSYTPESRHYRKKRLDEWTRPINESENHMHRAAHLADEKIAEMSYLVSPVGRGSSDCNLYFAAWTLQNPLCALCPSRPPFNCELTQDELARAFPTPSASCDTEFFEFPTFG
jgi:hypothetical protein